MKAIVLHLVAGWAALGASPEIPPNPVLKSLLNDGVAMPNGDKIKLPPPIMDESMTAAMQTQALAMTASTARSNTAAFLAENTSAPMLIRVKTLDKSKETDPTYRTVDIAFVAHGKWSVLTDPEFGKKILKDKKPAAGQPAGNNTVEKAGFLTKEEIAARGLKPALDIDQGNFMRKEAWLQTTFNLFDQVQISASRHVIVTKGPASVVLAAQIDPRFDKDTDYPNQWRAINPGKPLGLVNPYKGTGFYIKVVKLAQPADVIFCEYHSVIYEPHGWFEGANVLRANLPKVANFQAKQFRIKLLTFVKAPAAPVAAAQSPPTQTSQPTSDDKPAPNSGK